MYIMTGPGIDQYATAIKVRGGHLDHDPQDGWGMRTFSITDPDGFKLTFMTMLKKVGRAASDSSPLRVSARNDRSAGVDLSTGAAVPFTAETHRHDTTSAKDYVPCGARGACALSTPAPSRPQRQASSSSSGGSLAAGRVGFDLIGRAPLDLAPSSSLRTGSGGRARTCRVGGGTWPVKGFLVAVPDLPAWSRSRAERTRGE